MPQRDRAGDHDARSSGGAVGAISGPARRPGLPDSRWSDAAFRPVVALELADAAAVHDLAARSELLIESTSFGGIHTSVDRRARWGDPVVDGFARLSAGIEDTDDLVADVERGLSAT